MKRHIDFIIGLLFDVERKSFLNIINDLRKINSGKGFLNYSNYFQSLMHKKDAGNISDYFDGELMHKIILNFNRQGKHVILEDKIKFANLMITNEISTAKYVGCIRSGVLISKDNDRYDLSNKDAVISIISIWLNEYKTLFIKKIDTSGGKGIVKIDNGDTIDIDVLDFDSDYIIEQGLIQHQKLNQINPSCINSLRVISIKVENEVFIASCFLRVGTGNSFVDNSSAGGIFVHYNLSDNRLGKKAYTKAGSGAKSYFLHPNTKFSFDGQQLPYPHEVESLVKKSAHIFDDINLIGWDIAYTVDGPVILEGNSNPSLQGPQITLKGLNKNKIYKEYFSNL